MFLSGEKTQTLESKVGLNLSVCTDADDKDLS